MMLKLEKEIFAIWEEIAEIREVMGTEYTRKKAILNKIKAIEKLLNSKEYITAGERIATLESVLGTKDKEIVRLRTILDFERD